MLYKISFRIDITLFLEFNEIEVESETYVFTSSTTTMINLTRRTCRSTTFNCYYSTVVESSDIEELRSTVVDDSHEIERWVYQLMTKARKWYNQSRQSKSFLSVVFDFARKFNMIWLIQDFYMNKLTKKYVINIEYKATTLLSYQSLKSYIDEINQEKVHVYR
jgi:hypothetical protein